MPVTPRNCDRAEVRYVRAVTASRVVAADDDESGCVILEISFS